MEMKWANKGQFQPCGRAAAAWEIGKLIARGARHHTATAPAAAASTA